MKVVSSLEMARIEQLAYQQGASEEAFMLEAGKEIAWVVQQYVRKHCLEKRVALLCGKGNNAGDTYVAGIHLLKAGFVVSAFQLASFDQCTPLCQKQWLAFSELSGTIREIRSTEEVAFPQEGVILDGLFGTGFHGALKGPYASVVKQANRSGLPLIAVDIPSGLDGESGIISGEVIKAHLTVFLQLPKTGFFLHDAWNVVGELQLADFGLPANCLEQANADFLMITPDLARQWMPTIVRNRHKYQAGYVVGLAGSPGMPGAALLSSLAALRGGAGIVRLMHPAGMEAELSSSAYEIIKAPYQVEDVEGLLREFNRASAIFIGPGIGRQTKTAQLLQEILLKITKPCVIDGDALSLIGIEGFSLPSQTILTPHRGELLKLLQLDKAPDFDKHFLKTCQSYVEQKQTTLVIKGAPTFILHPGKLARVCPRGDPGMATAGSGDVLTGLIAALLAQGLNPFDAASLGVYLHSVAGEYAAKEKTSYCVIASDLIAHFPEAFKAEI